MARLRSVNADVFKAIHRLQITAGEIPRDTRHKSG
jgi:hypothetical protein